MASSRTYLRCMVLLVLSAVYVAAFDCRQSSIKDKCDEYFRIGGISVVLEDHKNVGEFTPDLEDKFVNAVANVSNDYVILTVIPSEHVARTDVVAVYGRVEVRFFILNPSGSVVVPTAFRAQELFLMMKLNDKDVELLFGQSVKPIDPKPDPLAIPIWAIAILGYAGVVVLCGIMLYATRDWRKKKQQELEDDLGMSNMEKGKPLKDNKIPMNDIHKPINKQPTVTYSEAGVQTEYLPKRESKELPKDEPPPYEQVPNGHTIHATIENGSDDDDHSENTDEPAQETSSDDGHGLIEDTQDQEDMAASGGVENKAFDKDDEEDEMEEVTSEEEEKDDEKNEEKQEEEEEEKKEEEKEEVAKDEEKMEEEEEAQEEADGYDSSENTTF